MKLLVISNFSFSLILFVVILINFPPFKLHLKVLFANYFNLRPLKFFFVGQRLSVLIGVVHDRGHT